MTHYCIIYLEKNTAFNFQYNFFSLLIRLKDCIKLGKCAINHDDGQDGDAKCQQWKELYLFRVQQLVT